MGAASSVNQDELMAETEDVTTLKNACGKFLDYIEEEDACAKYCKPVMERGEPKDDDTDGWKERRAELHRVANEYLQVVQAAGGNAPEDVEALVSAQSASGTINLSKADRDDNEVAGMLHVFDLAAISVVPESVLTVGVSLTTLLLKKNGIRELPEGISALSGLKELDLSENELSTLCPELCQLESLESLNISENQIESLPAEIGNLKNLSTLIAFKNKLTTLPDEIGGCAALEEVNFFNNKLIKMPNSMADLENLVDLNLGGNKIKSCPSTKKWVNLERLALTWNTIVVLNDFGGMTKLRQLQLGRNQLAELPEDAFAGCDDLETVDLSTNNFTKLPASLMQCSSISTLDATSNQLAALDDFSNLAKLKILKLGSNKLTDVGGANLHNCAALETLFLSGNELTTLPRALEGLPVISRMNISGNKSLDRADPDTLAVIEVLSERCKDNKGRWID